MGKNFQQGIIESFGKEEVEQEETIEEKLTRSIGGVIHMKGTCYEDKCVKGLEKKAKRRLAFFTPS